MQLDRSDIDALPPRQRTQLINGLPGYKPALLVGTRHNSLDNLAIISSVFHVGASPPLLGMILRPNPEGTERHTLDNILATGEYTLNGFRVSDAARAHQTSARYPRTTSEFSACGFTAYNQPASGAPFVAEAPLQIACQLREHQMLAVNGTHLLIGEIVWLQLPDGSLRDDGSIDWQMADLPVVTGLDSYHPVGVGIRYRYAKPDTPPEIV